MNKKFVYQVGNNKKVTSCDVVIEKFASRPRNFLFIYYFPEELCEE